MRHIRRLGHFWWAFVVGDDWTIALGVLLGLTLTWVETHHGENWFWFMPVVVLATLATSLRRLTARISKGSNRPFGTHSSDGADGDHPGDALIIAATPVAPSRRRRSCPGRHEDPMAAPPVAIQPSDSWTMSQ